MRQAIALTLVIVTLISCHSSTTQEEHKQLQGTSANKDAYAIVCLKHDSVFTRSPVSELLART